MRIFFMLAGALLTAGCDLFEGSAVQPTPILTLEIQGPSRLEIGQGAAFTARLADSAGKVSDPGQLTWSATPESVLTIDRATGAATARKSGTATVAVKTTVQSAERSMTVIVTPKARLLIVGLPPTIMMGGKGEVKAVAMIDDGTGEREVPLAALGAAIPGSSTIIQWSTTTTGILSVRGRLLTEDLADFEALAPGTGIVQVSVAGLTATAFTTVLAASTVVPPPTSLIDLAIGTYSVAGRLESNTCAGTSPISSYTGQMVIGQSSADRVSVKLSYLDREQREFRAAIAAAFPDTGAIEITSDRLPFPFGNGSPVTSTRLSGRVSPTGAATSLTEEMSCNGGSIIFSLRTIKLGL